MADDGIISIEQRGEGKPAASQESGLHTGSRNVEMLAAMLHRPRAKPYERTQAVHLLAETGDPAAIPALFAAIEDTSNPFVLQTVTAVLSALPQFGAAAIPFYETVLVGDDTQRRPFIPRLLAETGDRDAVIPILLSLLTDQQEPVAVNAATALGTLKATNAIEPLMAIMHDENQSSVMRGVAASALGDIGDPHVFAPLRDLLAFAAVSGTGSLDLLAGAIDGLANLADRRAISPLQQLLDSGSLDDRIARGIRLAIISLRGGRD